MVGSPRPLAQPKEDFNTEVTEASRRPQRKELAVCSVAACLFTTRAFAGPGSTMFTLFARSSSSLLPLYGSVNSVLKLFSSRAEKSLATSATSRDTGLGIRGLMVRIHRADNFLLAFIFKQGDNGLLPVVAKSLRHLPCKQEIAGYDGAVSSRVENVEIPQTRSAMRAAR